MPDKLLVVVTVPLHIRTLTGTPLQIYPHPPSHPWFYSFRLYSNKVNTKWKCNVYLLAMQSVPGYCSHLFDSCRKNTIFCVYCSQLSIRRPATKETRPEAKSSLSVSLLETSLEVGTGTRYWGRRQVASIAHRVAATGRVKRVESRSNHRNP